MTIQLYKEIFSYLRFHILTPSKRKNSTFNTLKWYNTSMYKTSCLTGFEWTKNTIHETDLN